MDVILTSRHRGPISPDRHLRGRFQVELVRTVTDHVPRRASRVRRTHKRTSLSARAIIAAVIETGGRCFYCGDPAQQIDHVVSLKRRWQAEVGYKPEHWGTPDPYTDVQKYGDRLVAACATCNSDKGILNVEEFRCDCVAETRFPYCVSDYGFLFWAEAELGLSLEAAR